METYLGSHLSESFKPFPKADEQQVLICIIGLDYLSTTGIFLDVKPALDNPPLPLQPQPELICQAVVKQACAGCELGMCIIHACPDSSAETATVAPVTFIRALSYTFSLSSPTCYLSQMSLEVMRYLDISVCLQHPDSDKILLINLRISLRTKILVFLVLP